MYNVKSAAHKHCFATCAKRVYLLVLFPALGARCNSDAYKNWTATENPKVNCLLGQKVVYQRRRAQSLCYNGMDYDRPISVINCSCTVDDYEW